MVINGNVSPELVKELDKIAKIEDRSRSKMIEMIVSEFVNNYNTDHLE